MPEVFRDAEDFSKVSIPNKEIAMIYPLILAVIGFATMLSGIWEQVSSTIIVGVIMQVVGWIWFLLAWRKEKQKGQK